MLWNHENKPLHVWSLPPHKTVLLSKKFVLTCIPVPKNSHRRCSVKKDVIRNLGNFTRKHICWSLHLIKLQAWRPVTLFEKDSSAVFSCEILQNYKSNYFEENLRATVPEHLGKISPLLVLGKPLLDGKRHNWAILKIWTS